ncbi:MAG: transposase [Chloroflexi bacterium]|nr:transposase [Chloroflexota bacterium]
MIYPNDTPPTVPSQVAPRPTYPQDWHAYNAAQTSEKPIFMRLLADLCSSVEQPSYKRGRPRLPLADMIYTSACKVYAGFSARRFNSDVEDSLQKGFVDTAPSFNSVNRCIANPDLTPILKTMIEESAKPLQAIETDFAVDSTGFSTSTYARWYDHKWGKERIRQTWVKCHIAVGVKTHVVTAVEATATESADTSQLPNLVTQTAKNFTVKEISGDKAYSSRSNLRAVEAVGGIAFIPFKDNSVGKDPKRKVDGLWNRMWHYYNFNQASFLEHYHKRSNVESAFSMIKAKFGGSVIAKTPTAQVNEVLLKVLCHNLCVLVGSIYELGIEPVFALPSPESKVIDLNQYRRQNGI